MSLQHFGKATLRVAKNYTKGYSDVQAKVREATSNDPWGPSGSQMNEIAQMTYNQNDFVEIMEMIDKRLNDKGKNWRHVFKALTLLDYCLHAGSENVVIYFKDNLYIIKTLKEFQYIDEYEKDQGANVRQKAKDITNLLQDESRLREARRNRASMRDRMLSRDGEDEPRESPRESPLESSRRAPPKRTNREDDELKRAIEASKQSFNQEHVKQVEDRDLAAALKLSQEEEEARRKAGEDANAKSLFDDNPSNSNNPFPLINFDAQPTAQPQLQYLEQQQTSFNPYWQEQQAQQAQQEAMQAEWLRQQQQQQQQQLWAQQQQELQSQQQQQQQLQAQQEEWLRQQREQEQWMLQQQQLQQQQQQQQQQQEWLQQQMLLQQQQQQQQPSITGFGQNNPFAPTQSPQPQLPQPSTQSPVPPHPSQPSVSPTPTKKRDDGEHAHLASLLANRTEDGIDTFGNIGNLRYGHTQAGRVVAQSTGNPFARQQQQPPGQQQGEQPFFSI